MALDPLKAREYLSIYKGWRTYSKSIVKTYVFKGFREAIRFVSKVSELAEEMDHHPDICIYYNKVRIRCSTRRVGGISIQDIELAGKIESIYRDFME